MDTLSKNLDAYWMPFTSNRDFKNNPRMIVSAKGHYYQDENGRQIFDGLSGLWACGLGHGRDKISEAVYEQVKTLDYSPAFQFGHPTIFDLSNKLIDFMPSGINRFFYSTSGSESVETALKVARAYWRKKGQAHKTKFIGRSRGYHGVNWGGISVGGISGNKALYGQGLEAIHMPDTILPETLFSKGMPEQGAHLADVLSQLIHTNDASTIAAVIIEPVAGSTGVIPPPKEYLQKIREICTKHDILLIFDEVITGLGRIGAPTGAHEFNVTPDILTLAKQITNGVIPMGVTAVKQSIYDIFMEQGGSKHMVEMPHGYTYSGHPVACAAALATLDLLEKEKAFAQVKSTAPYFEKALHGLRGLPFITDLRNYGLAAGLSIDAQGREVGIRPYEIGNQLWKKGFYVRFNVDTIQLGLPFFVSQQEIDNLINALGETIQSLH